MSNNKNIKKINEGIKNLEEHLAQLKQERDQEMKDIESFYDIPSTKSSDISEEEALKEFLEAPSTPLQHHDSNVISGIDMQELYDFFQKEQKKKIKKLESSDLEKVIENQINGVKTTLKTNFMNFADHVQNIVTASKSQAAIEEPLSFFEKFKRNSRSISIYILGCLLTATSCGIFVKYETKKTFDQTFYNALVAGHILIKAYPKMTKTEKEKLARDSL